MHLRIIAAVLVGVALASCVDGTGTGSIAHTPLPRLLDSEQLTPEVSVTKIRPDSGEALMIAAPKEGRIAGMSLTIPAGALGLEIALTIEESESLASKAALDEMGLANNSFEKVAPAVMIAPSELTRIWVPMTLAIPIPDGAGALALNGGASEQSRIVVIFRSMKPDGSPGTQGIIPTSALKFREGGLVEFSTLDWGSFQSAVMTFPVTEAVEVQTDKPVLSKREAQKLPDPVWAVVTYRVDPATRVLDVHSVLTGVQGVRDCAAVIDDDKLAPWLATLSTGAAPVAKHQITLNPAHTLYVRFECSDEHARLLVSEWQRLDIPVGDDIPPAQFKITGPIGVTYQRNATLAWGVAKDAVRYRAVVARDAACKDEVASVATTTATTAALPKPLDDGRYHICAQAFDQHDNMRAADNNGLAFIVHTTVPNTTITTAPRLFNFDAVSQVVAGCQGGPCTYQYRIDFLPWQASADGRINATLDEGPHTIEVRAIDLLGAVDPTPEVLTFTIDRTPPSIPMLNPFTKTFHSPTTVAAMPDVKASADTFELRYAFGAAPSSCTSGTAVSGPITISGAANVALHVVACDRAGNRSAAAVGNYTYSAYGANLQIDAIAGDPNDISISGGISPGPAVTFTVTNNGPDASPSLASTVSLSNLASFSFLSDNCVAALPVGASCIVSVMPIATTNGSYNGSLNVSAGSMPSHALAGTATGFAVSLVLSPGSSTSTMDITGGVSPGAPVIMTLTNSGSLTTGTLNLPALAGSNPTNFEIISDACTGVQLAVSASCQFQVRPKATANGAFAATVSIGDGSTTSNTVALSGTASGYAPQLSISPGSATLNITGGSSPSAPATFTITNTGNYPSAPMVSPNLTGADPGNFLVSSDTCSGNPLAVSATCTIQVRAIAAANLSYNAMLTATDGTVSSSSASLNGTSSGFLAALSLSAGASTSTMNIIGGGSPGAPVTFTLTNMGPAPTIVLQAPNLTGANPGNFQIASDTCTGSVLAPSASCTFDVRPAAVTNTAYSALINIGDTVVTSNLMSLSGNASGFAPTLSITPPSQGGMDIFGGVSPGAPVMFTLTNTGTATSAVLQTPVIAGPNPGQFQITSDACTGVVLAPGVWCDIQVQPIAANDGAYIATLSVSDGAVTSSIVTMSGNASGFYAMLSLSPPFASNMDIVGGISPGAPTTFYVTNTGTLATTPLDPPSFWGSDPGNFTVTANTCAGMSLAPGAFCTFDISPTAVSTSSYTAMVNITASPVVSNPATLSGSANGFGGCNAHRFWRLRYADAGQLKVRSLRFLEPSNPLPLWFSMHVYDGSGGNPWDGLDSYATAFWQSGINGPGSWLGVDMGPSAGDKRCVESIIVQAGPGSGGMADVEWSDDNISWTPDFAVNLDASIPTPRLYSRTGGGVADTCVVARSMRTRRIGGNNGWGVAELHFSYQGTPLNGSPISMPGGGNWAFDYNPSTFFGASSSPMDYVGVDLPDVSCFDLASIELEGPGSYGTYAFEFSQYGMGGPWNAAKMQAIAAHGVPQSVPLSVTGPDLCMAHLHWRARYQESSDAFKVNTLEFFESAFSPSAPAAFPSSDSDWAPHFSFNAFDMQASTYWRSMNVGPSGWVGAKIGWSPSDARCIREVRLGVEPTSTGSVAIESSDDGFTWAHEFNVNAVAGLPRTYTRASAAPVACVAARAMRIRRAGGGVSWGVRELWFGRGGVAVDGGHLAMPGGGAQAFDGNDSTIWFASMAQADHIGMDFWDSRCIDTVKINLVDVQSRGTYVIEFSETGSGPWHTARNVDIAVDSMPVAVPLSPTSSDLCMAHQFWRARYLEPIGAFKVNTLKFFDGAGSELPLWSHLADSEMGPHWAPEAFDGSPTTYWQSWSTGSAAWIGMRTGSSPSEARCVTSATVGVEAASTGAVGIESSDDGTNWSPAFSINTVAGLPRRYERQGGGAPEDCIIANAMRIRRLGPGLASWGVRELAFGRDGAMFGGGDFASPGGAFSAFDNNPGTVWWGAPTTASHVGLAFSDIRCVNDVRINLADVPSQGTYAVEFSQNGPAGPWHTARTTVVNTSGTNHLAALSPGDPEVCLAHRYWRVRHLGSASRFMVKTLRFHDTEGGPALPYFSASQDSVFSGNAYDAFDGDPNSYWESWLGFGAWIAMDLGFSDAKCVRETALIVGPGSEGPVAIEASDDSTNWNQVYTFTVGAPNTLFTGRIDGTVSGGGGGSICARTWRVRLASGGTSNWALRELEFRNQGATVPGGGEFADSVDSGLFEWLAFDFNFSSRWQSMAGPGAFLGKDYGAPQCVDEVRLQVFGPANTGDVVIETSPSGPGGPWSVVASATVSAFDTDVFLPVGGGVMMSGVMRSVAVGANTAIATGGGFGPLTVSAGHATVPTPLPGNVGPGDVLTYDVNNDSVPDAIAFIIAVDGDRRGAALQDANGAATAVPTGPTNTNWQIHRAYVSLQDALYGVENPGIPSALRNFDSGPRNLGSLGKAWMFVAYPGSGPDGPAHVDAGWITTPAHPLLIMSAKAMGFPGSATLGHTGKLSGSGYRLDGGANPFSLRIDVPNVEVSGLQLTSSNPSGVVVDVNTMGAPGDFVTLTGNIIAGNSVASQGIRVNSWAVNEIRIANNVVHSFGNYGIRIDNAIQTVMANNTVVNVSTAYSTSSTAVAVNNLALGTGFGFSGPFHGGLSTRNAAPDGSAPGSAPIYLNSNNVFDYLIGTADDYHVSLGAPYFWQLDNNGVDPHTLGIFLPRFDIDRQPRTSANWDIGADEF